MKGFSSCGGWKKAPATAYCFLETPALAEKYLKSGSGRAFMVKRFL